MIHERHGRHATSFNWSGYAITGADDLVSDVKRSWTVQAIQGKCPSTTQYASFWVGIDEYDSNTVEQIGTDSDCQNGSPIYYAWYEFYPHFSYNVPITIQQGDVTSAEVGYSGGKFTLYIKHVTSGASWSTEKVANAKRSSAEWIIEAPSSTGGVSPLADFCSIGLGFDTTKVTGTCAATLGGASGPTGSASFAENLVELTMVASNGTTVMSQPSPVSVDETSFTDTWENTGP